MVLPLNEHQAEIAALCRRYGVKKLELFGSAARGDFDQAQSDIDLFYEFDSDPSSLADRFFGLLEDLERLFGRKVDLVSSRDARNPYFLQVANQHRVTLYAA
jgi:predicted nucleotidyltransferase